MELKSVSGQINIAQIAGMRKDSGRISLPVSRAMTPYAQFKYVKGIPSSSPGGSLSIDRLRVLNNLINSLVGSQGNPVLAKDSGKMSDQSLKALIDQYSSQLHSALNASGSYGVANISYTSGSLVNVFI